MSEFYYENQGELTYLVYELGQDDKVDSVSLGMLTNNAIDNIAPIIYTEVNERQILKFNVTARLPLSNYLYGIISRSSMIDILYGISKALLASEEYMLNKDCFVLNDNYIYVDVNTKAITMICLPVETESDQKYDLRRRYFKELIFKTTYDLHDNNDYLAAIINSLNGSSNFSVKRFYDVLSELNPKQAVEPAAQTTQTHSRKTSGTTVQTSGVDEPGIPDNLKPYINNVKPHVPEGEDDGLIISVPTKKEKPMSLLYLLRNYNKENLKIYKAQRSGNTSRKPKDGKVSGKVKKPIGFDIPGQESNPYTPNEKINIPDGNNPKVPNRTPAAPASTSNSGQRGPEPVFRPDDFGDTVYVDDTSEISVTTLFNDRSNSKITPTLIRKRNNERIRIDSPVFRIGRDSGFNNYAVTDNRYVGHTHCHIVSRGGEFFLVDDNSKNHTYLDGQQIPPSTEIKLSHGQKFRLSDEEFEFLLY